MEHRIIKIYTETVPDEPNVNGVVYSKKVYNDCIDSDKIRKKLSNREICVTLGGTWGEYLPSVPLKEIIGKVISINDDNIIIDHCADATDEEVDAFIDMVKHKRLTAYMNYMAHVSKGNVTEIDDIVYFGVGPTLRYNKGEDDTNEPEKCGTKIDVFFDTPKKHEKPQAKPASSESYRKYYDEMEKRLSDQSKADTTTTIKANLAPADVKTVLDLGNFDVSIDDKHINFCGDKHEFSITISDAVKIHERIMHELSDAKVVKAKDAEKQEHDDVHEGNWLAKFIVELLSIKPIVRVHNDTGYVKITNPTSFVSICRSLGESYNGHICDIEFYDNSVSIFMTSPRKKDTSLEDKKEELTPAESDEREMTWLEVLVHDILEKYIVVNVHYDGTCASMHSGLYHSTIKNMLSNLEDYSIVDITSTLQELDIFLEKKDVE